jgi:hypothetical protein
MDFDRLFDVYLKVMKVAMLVAVPLALLSGFGEASTPSDQFWGPAISTFVVAVICSAFAAVAVAIADQFLNQKESGRQQHLRPGPIEPVFQTPAPPASEPQAQGAAPSVSSLTSDSPSDAPATPDESASEVDPEDPTWSDRQGQAMDEAREDLES